LPLDAIFELKIHQNAFAAGALPDPTAELTALPQTHLQLVGRGLAAPSQKPTTALGPVGLEFSALGLKEVVHPCPNLTLNSFDSC